MTDRTPEEMVHAAKTRANNTIKVMTEGVCEKSAGEMTSTLQICDDHEETGVCSNCHRRIGVTVMYRCGTCKASARVPIRNLISSHPAVVGFYWERGIPLQYDVKDFRSVVRRDRVLSDHSQSLHSTDPVRIDVMVEYEGDDLRLTLDEELNVVTIQESTQPED